MNTLYWTPGDFVLIYSLQVRMHSVRNGEVLSQRALKTLENLRQDGQQRDSNLRVFQLLI